MPNPKLTLEKKSSDDIAIEADCSVEPEKELTKMASDINELLNFLNDIIIAIESTAGHDALRLHKNRRQQLLRQLGDYRQSSSSKSLDERTKEIDQIQKAVGKLYQDVKDVQSSYESITGQPSVCDATLSDRANERSLHTQKTDEKTHLLDHHADKSLSETERLPNQEKRHYSFWTCFGLCDCDEGSSSSLQHN